MLQRSPGWLCMHAPGMQRYTRCSFYTLGDVFSCTIGEFYTDKLYSQSKHRSKEVTHTRVTAHSTKACSAATRLHSCSLDTLTSLIFLNEEELSHKAAQQQGLSGQADTVCTSC